MGGGLVTQRLLGSHPQIWRPEKKSELRLSVLCQSRAACGGVVITERQGYFSKFIIAAVEEMAVGGERAGVIAREVHVRSNSMLKSVSSFRHHTSGPNRDVAFSPFQRDT